jgi:hypothetical protein
MILYGEVERILEEKATFLRHYTGIAQEGMRNSRLELLFPWLRFKLGTS